MALRPSPEAEVDVSAELARALLEDQHPDLAHLPLEELGAGWDNALFRLGDSLAVRLPRRSVAAPLVLSEQRWLPELAPRLPLPVPTPVRVGRPGRGYPWSWHVTPWFEGSVAEGPVLGHTAARTLGRFLDVLHAAAPADAPHNSFRSGPLTTRGDRLHGHVADLHGIIDRDRVLACWDRLSAAAPWSDAAVWVHGDLHPYNVLVAGADIVAVIDFGDLCAGDPAVDLAAAWMLFGAPARTTFRTAYRQAASGDDDLWRRARGWALALNLAWLVQSADDEAVTRQTLATIEAVLDDTAS